LSVSPPPHVVNLEGGEPGEVWGDFVAASETMLPYLVAYDIVAPELTTPEDRLIRHRLAAEAIQLYHYLPVATPNNHKTVMAVAVGAAALCLSPHEDYEISPERWMERAVETLEVGLSEISRDGSYKEGPYYATYIAQQTFAFFLFLKKPPREWERQLGGYKRPLSGPARLQSGSLHCQLRRPHPSREATASGG